MAKCPTAKWLAASASGEGISPRSSLAACLAADGLVYCFGGLSNEDDGSYFSDLRHLQVREDETVLNWGLVNPSGNCPAGREGHGLLSLGRKLYLLGGVTAEDDTRFSPKVFAYDIDDRSWEKIEVSGNPPTGINPTYCNVGEKIFVFGGIFDGTPSNSVFMLDTVGKKWTILECTGIPPQPRCDHAVCVIDDVMYVYGGCGGEDLLFSDVFQLNTSTLTWSQVEVSGRSAGPRDYSTLTPYGKEGLLVFGGSRDDVSVPEMYFISLEKTAGEWKLLTAEGEKPADRFGHAAVLCSSLLVFIAGVCAADGIEDRDLNDVCVLSLPGLKVEESAPFEPTTLPENHFADPPQPARRRIIPAPKLVSARDYEEMKQNVMKSITESFDQMVDNYLKLDQERETLRLEKAGLEEDKRQLERMQKEHEELFEKQRKSNEEWLEDRRGENDKERQAISNEKARLNKERAHLEQERETFDQKNKKLEAIMNQFKGIG